MTIVLLLSQYAVTHLCSVMYCVVCSHHLYILDCIAAFVFNVNCLFVKDLDPKRTGQGVIFSEAMCCFILSKNMSFAIILVIRE